MKEWGRKRSNVDLGNEGMRSRIRIGDKDKGKGRREVCPIRLDVMVPERAIRRMRMEGKGRGGKAGGRT